MLSIIVVIYNMEREIERTLNTLSSDYQQVTKESYEVIIVDNGSAENIDHKLDHHHSSMDFRYHYVEDASPSPAKAINIGVKMAKGNNIAIMVDGARMLSPGILKYSLGVFKQSYSNPVISTLAFHLGFELQQISSNKGYNQEAEDELLKSVDWKTNGYELFNISTFSGSSKSGWFSPLPESNCFMCKRSHFEAIGGADERFDLPGGGLVNLDLYTRLISENNPQNHRIIGEGTFHQYHGGSSTNNKGESKWEMWHQQYTEIRGKDYKTAQVDYEIVGNISERLKYSLPPSALTFMHSYKDSIKSKISGKAVIILGMHRSGTSMLTGTLQEAGLFLGNVITQSPYNKKGNRESKTSWYINDRVLEVNHGSWDNPVSNPEWDARAREVRDFYLRQFRGKKLWGFKDPRTVLTLQGWLDAIPEFQLVGIFRHPFLVAQSLMKRQKMPYEKSLQLWLEYNWRMEFYIKQYGMPLIEFHQDPKVLLKQINNLANYLKLPNIKENYDFFDLELRNQTLPEIKTNNARQALAFYEKLKSLESFIE